MAKGRAKVAFPKRGSVWLVDLDPTRGREIAKTRPALVIQNDIGNRFSDVTIVAAITSQFHLPVHRINVQITPPEGGLKKDSVVRLDQIRSVDKVQLLKRLGSLKLHSMAKVDAALRISLGLVDTMQASR